MNDRLCGRLIHKALNSRTMKQIPGFGWMTALLSAILLIAQDLKAQIPSVVSDGALTVHIDGLTTQDRDAIQQRLGDRSDLKLVFACVPAGIMVFTAEAGVQKSIIRQRAIPELSTRIDASRITEMQQSIAESESACAQARN